MNVCPLLDTLDLAPAVSWRRRFRPIWKAYALWLRADCVDLSAAFATTPSNPFSRPC